MAISLDVTITISLNTIDFMMLLHIDEYDEFCRWDGSHREDTEE